MNVEQWPIDSVIPYARNPRKNENAVLKVAASIKEYGWRQPIVVDAEGVVIAGHTRLLAAKHLKLETVPVHVASDMNPIQAKAYRLADNRVAQEAEWDDELLALEIEELGALGLSDLDALGFEDDELANLRVSDVEETEGLTDPDEVPEPPEESTTKPGDLWQLGRHRLLCGDSTKPEDVERLMNNKVADLMHADPPYGMGKEADGVANDNLYREKLDAFQMQWWQAFRPHLADNASAYIWGNAPDLWRLWYVGGLKDSERLTMRNEIVWNKNGGQGMSSDDFRMFPIATERCLFFMLGEQGFNNNADNYWEGFEPVRLYLQQQKDAIGWNNKTVADFFGFHPRMADHWFSKSQWSMPQKEQYKRLQKEANGDAFKREYDDLKREYDDLKREFYATRAYFDNTHDNMTDVWSYPRVNGEERHGHATPKPVEMMERVMRSSLPESGLCVEPFGGSGSTLMAAEKTNRTCFTMEIQPEYCDVIVQRWEDFTGQKAVLANG